MEDNDRVTIANALAYLAGSLIVLSFGVQIIKMIKIGSFKQLSYIFLALQMLVCILWAMYGLFNELFPVVIMNAMIFVVLVIALILKIVYQARTKNNDNSA